MLLFTLSLLTKGQEELLLMSGKRFVGQAIDTSDFKLIFNVEKRSLKFKTKSFFNDEVFSITYKDEIDTVFFHPSLYYVDDYTIENMRLVVLGKRDARYNYKTKWVIPTGIVVGAASALLMKGSVFVLLVPIAYTGIVQIPLVKIQKKSIASPEFIGNEFYAEGYNRTARGKRTKHALLSSIVGVVAGMLLYEVTK